MVSIFWNHKQGRLRTLWRLLLQVLMGQGLVVGLLALIFRPGIVSQVEELTGTSLPFVAASRLILAVSVWLAGRFLDRRRFVDFGFHLCPGWWLDLVFGLALGTALMGGVFFVQWAAGWVVVVDTFWVPEGSLSFGLAIILSLVVWVVVGASEELFSRGYHLLNLAEGLNLPGLGPRGGLLTAWLISSVIFGFLHRGNPHLSALGLFNLVLAGLFLGLGYILTGELAIPIGLHIAWNFVQGTLFGFPVSGVDVGPAVIATESVGPSLWTGGAFGPEGGLLGTVAMLVGSVAILGWVRWRTGKIALCMRLPEPPHKGTEPQGA